MVNVLIALAVIAVFAIGLLRALGIIGRVPPDYPPKEPK